MNLYDTDRPQWPAVPNPLRVAAAAVEVGLAVVDWFLGKLYGPAVEVPTADGATSSIDPEAVAEAL